MKYIYRYTCIRINVAQVNSKIVHSYPFHVIFLAAKSQALFDSSLHKPNLIPASRLETGICQSTGRVCRGFNIQPAT